MRHKVGYNALSRKSSHRKAMLRNMATSLFKYERIQTTKAKALEVKRVSEKMITRAKVDSVHNRRIIAKDIWDKAIVNKLFTDIGPRNANRPGGYTRMFKLGTLRQGDAAEMVILELVEQPVEEVKEEAPAKKEKKSKKKD